MEMNTKVRQTVREVMNDKKMSTYKLAELTDMSQPNVARALTGRSGSIPTTWVRILNALGLELVAIPKGTDLPQSKAPKEGK
jgi:DNA-binding phage protein